MLTLRAPSSELPVNKVLLFPLRGLMEDCLVFCLLMSPEGRMGTQPCVSIRVRTVKPRGHSVAESQLWGPEPRCS